MIYKFIEKEEGSTPEITFEQIEETHILQCVSNDEAYAIFCILDNKGAAMWQAIDCFQKVVQKDKDLNTLVEKMKKVTQGFKIVQVVDIFDF